MRISDLRKILLGHLEYWKENLNLHDWHIKIEVKRYKGKGAEGNIVMSEFGSNSSIEKARLEAVVTIFYNSKDAINYEKVLLHELFHIVFFDLSSITIVLMNSLTREFSQTASIGNIRTSRNAFYTEYNKNENVVVEKLTKIFYRMRYPNNKGGGGGGMVK